MPATIDQARDRFSAAKLAWSHLRDDFNRDSRFVNVVGGQWDPAIKAARADDGRPAQEFNELHTYVLQISNRARSKRSEPKVNPGDGGDPQTADALEGKLRHIEYESQADFARDGALEDAVTGGFGFYRITREYASEKSFNQEPRVRRILDPTTVIFGYAEEPDFSDAKDCFVRKRIKRTEFKRETGHEPLDFGQFDSQEWTDKDYCYIAEWWHVETEKKTLQQLDDGQVMLEEERPAGDSRGVLAEREFDARTVYCDLIDGARILESEEWPGTYIPIIPVLGRQKVVEGKQHLIGAVRFATDAQELKNSHLSGVAEMIGTANDSSYLGYEGQFKHKSWRSQKKQLYREIAPVSIDGKPAPIPQRVNVEPPIQSLSTAAMQMTDSMKRSVGYVDSIVRPSQGDISGVAVERRDQQQDLTNYHFEFSLNRSIWHEGRVILDLYLNLTDTPRPARIMGQDGKASVVPVTVQNESGQWPEVPGYEGQPHHKIDVGSYNATISAVPAYNTRREEEAESLDRFIQAEPNLAVNFLDLLWERRGYSDLAERAKLLLPPQIQQAQQAKQQGITPREQALQGQMQQMGQLVQKLVQMLQTKAVEGKAKLDVEKLKAIKDIMVQQMKHSHEAGKHLLTEHTDAIEHITQLLHDSESTPNTQEQMAMQQKTGAVQ